MQDFSENAVLFAGGEPIEADCEIVRPDIVRHGRHRLEYLDQGFVLYPRKQP